MPAILTIVLGAAIAAAVGDSTMAAIVTVIGTFANTVLIVLNHSNVRHIRATITAPRRLVYDADGNPIGTVIDLERAGGWDNWLVRHNRRVSDPPPADEDPLA